jgi:hypothetical protein
MTPKTACSIRRFSTPSFIRSLGQPIRRTHGAVDLVIAEVMSWSVSEGLLVSASTI